ncbi:MAG: tetratricopeptide repeat protein [Prevotellaceae bacterium]|jgi:tetratricopeptide (TPR) repeat protein|nr:tetratricopeptide repeat protein [Prevotellaceae bacterium]
MTKKLYMPLVAALLVALAACSPKMGELSSDYFTVTPQVLEAVGGKVPATINGKFPEKYFNKKAVVEVTPVLKWNGGEAKGQPTVFQGEKVEGNDQTISYKMGGNYTMRTSFDYVPPMAKSELYLEFKATVGKKTITIPAVKVADGVISTSELVENTLSSANPATGNDAFQRIIKEKKDANIMFLIQQANIRAGELKNAKDFNTDVKEVNDAENKKISNIEISAYASPDGGVSLNTRLAENRQDNTAKVVGQNLKKSKIDVAVDSKYTAQDWEGFQELVSQSNIQDKQVILRVLSMYQDPERREQEIKNISSVYKTLADEILPQLRRSRLTLNYEIIGKSDEEIANLAKSDAGQLNLEELLYAATLTKDAGEQGRIYSKATQLFPNDYRAYNNLGKLAYQAGQLDQAESYLKKALSLQSSAPETNMNLGLVALAKGDQANAQTYLSKASGAKELNETLGNLYIAQGQYDRAVTAFGDAKTNSAALAQILAKDYNKAKNTLASVSNKDAYTDYLNAVLGARTNNLSMVTSGLKAAITKNPTLAKKAANDLEFAKYFTNADFMNLIK